jgi:hypothetical protein
MPADSTTSISRGNGPAIQMKVEDHKLTSSYGSSTKAKEYRAEIQKMIEEGKFRSTMAKEIFDVKKKTGSKYNKAMLEMLEYSKKSEILPLKK